MLVQPLSKSQFRDAFLSAGRKSNFSDEGLELLFDFLQELSDDPFELDIVGLCSDYAEMDADEVREVYSVPSSKTVREYLVDNTLFVGETNHGTFVFLQF